MLSITNNSCGLKPLLIFKWNINTWILNNISNSQNHFNVSNPHFSSELWQKLSFYSSRLFSGHFLIHPPLSGKLISLKCKCDHVKPLLKTLQWLPRVQNKIQVPQRDGWGLIPACLSLLTPLVTVNFPKIPIWSGFSLLMGFPLFEIPFLPLCLNSVSSYLSSNRITPSVFQVSLPVFPSDVIFF